MRTRHGEDGKSGCRDKVSRVSCVRAGRRVWGKKKKKRDAGWDEGLRSVLNGRTVKKGANGRSHKQPPNALLTEEPLQYLALPQSPRRPCLCLCRGLCLGERRVGGGYWSTFHGGRTGVKGTYRLGQGTLSLRLVDCRHQRQKCAAGCKKRNSEDYVAPVQRRAIKDVGGAGRKYMREGGGRVARSRRERVWRRGREKKPEQTGEEMRKTMGSEISPVHDPSSPSSLSSKRRGEWWRLTGV